MSADTVFNGEGLWLFAILALFGFGGNGFFGGNKNGMNGDYATTRDVETAVNRSADFAALERQNNEIMQNTSNVGASVTTAIKDGNYNLLSEVRDLQAEAAAGFSGLQRSVADALRAVDSVKYDGAINTASINANTTAQVQKVLDAITTNRMADMQSQITGLTMQNAIDRATFGTVKYPSATTYYAGPNPYCSAGCGNL